MSSPYQALYEKRCHFDPFSCRNAIDCRTPLEDIFGAYLGELIERITQGISNWEVDFIYIPSIKIARSTNQDYVPTMILSQKELESLLGKPLNIWNATVSDRFIAWTIQAGFSDVHLALDGLTKLTRRILDPGNNWRANPAKESDCHQNAAAGVQAIDDMIEAITRVRNPSAHRDIQPTDVPMETISNNARIAYASICNALPVMKDVFCKFTAADEQYLRDRYCPLLLRVLNDLDKKLKGVDIDPTATQVHYKALSAYNIILDESALASGHTVTLNKLADEMDVFLYEDSLSSVAKATTNPDEKTKLVAKNALSTFYMAKENIVLMKNTKENDRQSILDALRNNPDRLFFVVTESRSFADQILALGNPRHIAARTCNNRGDFTIYRSESPDE